MLFRKKKVTTLKTTEPRVETNDFWMETLCQGKNANICAAEGCYGAACRTLKETR